MKIFLDLDGTILDVKYRCYRIYANMLSQAGFNIVDISTYWKMKRNKVSEEDIALKTTPLLFAKYYVEKRMDLIEAMDYLVLDRVLCGVYEILDKWSSNHMLYLVTLRRNKINLKRQLLLFDLYRYFKHIYSASAVGVKKEELIKYEVFGMGGCVIIGDTESDVEAGKVLSIKTAAVTSGIRKKCLLEKMFPDILSRDLCDFKLLNWIGNN